MTDIKSAFEKAMEKAAKIEKASPEELRRMESLPKGNAFAARFLDITGSFDLKGELDKASPQVRKYLVEGAEQILLRNIILPQTDAAKKANERAVEGLLLLKEDKRKAKALLDQVKQMLGYYDQQRQQTYAQHKSAFEKRLVGARRAMEQQTGVKAENISVKVEAQPQFQEEWRQILAQINAQYDAALNELKQGLKSIS